MSCARSSLRLGIDGTSVQPHRKRDGIVQRGIVGIIHVLTERVKDELLLRSQRSFESGFILNNNCTQGANSKLGNGDCRSSSTKYLEEKPAHHLAMASRIIVLGSEFPFAVRADQHGVSFAGTPDRAGLRVNNTTPVPAIQESLS